MSAKEADSLSSKISPQAPDQGPTSIMDTEMTCLLTLDDNNSFRSSTPSINNMPGYQPGRESSERLPSRPHRGDSRTSTVPNPPHNSGWQQDHFQGHSGSALGAYYHGHYDPAHPQLGSPPPQVVYAGSHSRSSSTLTSEDRVLLSAVQPGPVWPSDAQLSTAYGYGMRRDDGSFTRLIRADQLVGGYHGILPEYQGPEGLIIVPEPRQPSPGHRQGLMPLIAGDIVASLPPLNGPPSVQQHAPRYDPAEQAQHHIDSIIAQSASMSPPPRPFRKEKIYCDKWIHEGVCAFTQMGCKYKHEMPMDKATQMSLGLNHGIPNWYRRAYSVQLHSPPPPAPATALPSSSNQNRLSGNWRRLEGGSINSTPPSIAGVMQSGPPGARSSYGPIGPPPSQAPFYNNPFSTLKVEEREDDEEEEDDDTITWRGRRN